MVDVEDHISFTHVEVPGDHGGGVDDLDQQLNETAEEMKKNPKQTHTNYTHHHMMSLTSCGAPLKTLALW